MADCTVSLVFANYKAFSALCDALSLVQELADNQPWNETIQEAFAKIKIAVEGIKVSANA